MSGALPMNWHARQSAHRIRTTTAGLNQYASYSSHRRSHRGRKNFACESRAGEQACLRGIDCRCMIETASIPAPIPAPIPIARPIVTT
jgi:hypothetical protein